MNRKDFVKSMAASALGISSLSSLAKFTDELKPDGRIMPVLFVGHGSPMNAIEDNEFSQRWKKLGNEIPQPLAVIVVSAHWLTAGTRITAVNNPTTIHDFGGFPQKLFDVQYPAPGNPALAFETAALVKSTQVVLDHDWGLDHGAWSVVRNMYPDANIPVLQLSIDYSKPAQYHFDLAGELSGLRKKRILIMGSGNMVHNLRLMSWEMINGGGFDWAIEMNEKFKKSILSRDDNSLINYSSFGKAAELAIPTPDHYYPLMYSLGLRNSDDEITLFNDKPVGGSLTMTSVIFGN
jgi:4,5-DOPA dioxygenase extradiol